MPRDSTIGCRVLDLPVEWTPVNELSSEAVQSAVETAVKSGLARELLRHDRGRWLVQLWSKREMGVELGGRVGSLTAPFEPLDLPLVEREECRINVDNARLSHLMTGLVAYDIQIRRKQNAPIAGVPPRSAEEATTLPATGVSRQAGPTRGLRKPPKRYIDDDDEAVRKFLAARGISLPLSDEQAKGLWNVLSREITPFLLGDGQPETKHARARRALKRVTGR